MAKAWDAFHRDLQPYVLTVDSTGESVQFGYTPGTTTNSMFMPTTLQSLTFPNRKQSFTWMPYKYRKSSTGLQYTYDINPSWNDVYTSAGVT